MIPTDDLPESERGALQFVEYRVRLLVSPPQDGRARTLTELFEYEATYAVDLDAPSRTPLGRPVPCPQGCGQVAIDPAGYPWGPSGVWCPHCDGGEDVG